MKIKFIISIIALLFMSFTKRSKSGTYNFQNAEEGLSNVYDIIGNSSFNETRIIKSSVIWHVFNELIHARSYKEDAPCPDDDPDKTIDDAPDGEYHKISSIIIKYSS